eukprot:scaffold504598_cov20-Prasinocladus_malaysianus.AAC.1
MGSGKGSLPLGLTRPQARPGCNKSYSYRYRSPWPGRAGPGQAGRLRKPYEYGYEFIVEGPSTTAFASSCETSRLNCLAPLKM